MAVQTDLNPSPAQPVQAWLHFHYACGYREPSRLAHMLDSLVRVSRRVGKGLLLTGKWVRNYTVPRNTLVRRSNRPEASNPSNQDEEQLSSSGHLPLQSTGSHTPEIGHHPRGHFAPHRSTVIQTPRKHTTIHRLPTSNRAISGPTYPWNRW